MPILLLGIFNEKMHSEAIFFAIKCINRQKTGESSKTKLKQVVHTTGRAQPEKYSLSIPPDGSNRKNIRCQHHRFIGTRIKTGRPHHRTGPTGNLLAVHTTVLSEPELKQVVHTTGQAQLEN